MTLNSSVVTYIICEEESFHSPLGYDRRDQFIVVAPTPCHFRFLPLIEKRSSDVQARGANVAVTYSLVCI